MRGCRLISPELCYPELSIKLDLKTLDRSGPVLIRVQSPPVWLCFIGPGEIIFVGAKLTAWDGLRSYQNWADPSSLMMFWLFWMNFDPCAFKGPVLYKTFGIFPSFFSNSPGVLL